MSCFHLFLVQGPRGPALLHARAEQRDNGLSPDGSALDPRPQTLENQAQEGLNQFSSVCFPTAPLKVLVAPEELKSVIKESLHHVSSTDSGSPAIKAM